MKQLFLRTAAAMCLCGAAAGAMAAPADGRPRQMQQPDGSMVTLCLVGDETFHCLMTPDGHVAVQQPDGFYYFAGNDGKPSSARVSDGTPAWLDANASFTAYRDANRNMAFLNASRSAQTMTRADKLGNSKWDNTDKHDLREVNTEGEYRVLVIMVNFADTKFSISADPHQTVDNMLNQPGFSDGDASGSVIDYYTAISNGQFHPVFDVYGPVDLDKTSAQYVNTDETYIKDGKEVNVYAPGRMVEEACKKLDSQIDFSRYDANNDGLVDFVYIFHAGKGATTGGNQNTTIWPHAFSLESAIGAPIELDGVKVNRYATSCEVNSRGNQLLGIGLFCHEFSHVLGLPDLYDTANNGTVSKVFSPGSFSNMDAGNYNNDLHTPPYFSSYEQYSLEWTRPVTLTGSGKFTLLPLSHRPFAYKLDVKENPMEYFLLEARAPYKWDEYLEGFGMLVWHIDFIERNWTNNTVNNQAAHQCIDIVEADDLQTATSRDGDPFPGATGVNELNTTSVPSLISWGRNSLSVELMGIVSNPDGTVDFRTTASSEMEGTALDAPQARIMKIENGTATASWEPVDNAKGYYVSVVNLDRYDTGYYRDFVGDWHFKDVKGATSAQIEGLEPGVNYGLLVYAYNDFNASRMAAPAEFTTQSADFASAATSIRAYKGAEGVELTWDAVPDASHYELTIATRAQGETAESDKCSFDEMRMAEGWSGQGRYDSREKYSGESTPSYNLNLSGSYLQTPKYERDIKEISFAGRCSFNEEESVSLEIFGIDAEGHRFLLGTVDDFRNAMAPYSFQFPEGFRQARLVVRSYATGQSVYLDDLNVSLTDGPVDTPVSGYAARKVEDTTLNATGLDANTTYVAYVKAFNGATEGKRSKAIEFRPGNLLSGVDDILTDIPGSSVIVSVADGAVTAEGMPMDIYTLDGMTIARGATSFTLPARGLYIVRVGSASKKICW